MEALNRPDAAVRRNEWRKSQECWLIKQEIETLDKLLWVQNQLMKLGSRQPIEPLKGRKVS